MLGPSGAGKTTLLRIVAGFERPDAGTLTLDGRDLLRVPAERRDVSLVVTGDALFPHMTVRGNLLFAMRALRADGRERARRIDEIASALGIRAHLDQRPQMLSAGERRRAALARAFLREPRVLLLDEPFAHLDPQLRASVREAFTQSRRRFTGGTMLVTHDHLEALADADRLAILIDGEIVQEGAPRDVYEFPADVRVAQFFGSPAMNLLEDGAGRIGIRPEHVRIESGGELRGTVARSEEAGADQLLHIDTPRGRIVVRARANQVLPSAGGDVSVALPGAFVRRFDADGRLLR